MKEVDIQFNVSGRIRQTVEILTDDTPEQFIQKLEEGIYYTTLGDSRDVIIVEGGDFKPVGKIVFTDPQDTEYFNIEAFEEGSPDTDEFDPDTDNCN